MYLTAPVSRSVFRFQRHNPTLRRIADLIDGGELKARAGTVLPLANAREAHLMLKSMLTPPKGKIVLRIAN
jgi:NADPH:quinone reductase-like Zn-dependent oxidoreductase